MRGEVLLRPYKPLPIPFYKQTSKKIFKDDVNGFFSSMHESTGNNGNSKNRRKHYKREIVVLETREQVEEFENGGGKEINIGI